MFRFLEHFAEFSAFFCIFKTYTYKNAYINALLKNISIKVFRYLESRGNLGSGPKKQIKF